MARSPATVTVLGLAITCCCCAPGNAQSPTEVRELYKKALPRLESTLGQEFHFTAAEKIDRTGIPAALAERVKAHESSRIEGFLKAGKQCVRLTAGPEAAQNATTIVVVDPPKSFLVVQKPGSRPTLVGQGTGEFERRIGQGLFFVEAAYRLPHLDVRKLIDGAEFQVTKCSTVAADAGKGAPELVRCEFRRLKPPATADERKQLMAESGAVSFIPSRDWAVSDFDYQVSNGVKLKGSVVYQDIAGLNTRSMPKTVEYRYIREPEGKPQVTTTVITGVISDVGQVDDRVFTLREYGIKLGDAGGIRPWMLLLTGATALFAAIALRFWGSRAKV